MPDAPPQFDQVNLVTGDLDATLAFYRRLGLAIPDPGVWPPGTGAVHAEAEGPGGLRFEFDNAEMACLWHAGWRDAPPTSSGTVLGFRVESRDAVDERYRELTAAGAIGRQAPYDAFWGARYAVVQDPDGRDVGLMSPIDPDRRYTPEP